MFVEDEQDEEEAPKKRKSANGAGKVSNHTHSFLHILKGAVGFLVLWGPKVPISCVLGAAPRLVRPRTRQGCNYSHPVDSLSFLYSPGVVIVLPPVVPQSSLASSTRTLLPPPVLLSLLPSSHLRRDSHRLRRRSRTR
jgi:hypothetical protein